VVQQGGNASKIQRTQADNCTYGEVRSFAYLNQSGFPAPANLADVKATIAATCSGSNPCSCYSGASAKGAQDIAAWRNIVAATGGSDLSLNANFMCVDTEECWFVHSCRPIYQPGQPRPDLQRRSAPLAPVATLSLNGHSIYFYRDTRNGNCPPQRVVH
jgi:hypothetical protein